MKKILKVKKIIGFLVLFLGFLSSALAQTGTLRGLVADAQEGKALAYGYVKVVETGKKYEVDANGIYTILNLSPGIYHISATYFSYDTFTAKFTIVADKITKLNIPLNKTFKEVDAVILKGETNKRAETDVDVGVVRVTAREIGIMPSVGGEPDLLQYLQVVPGAVFTGDQGGQLYLRGGSPVMNKVMLDGMIIYNPFHSIGLFSVFDSEFIGTAEIHTAGFGAEHGGRISAVVDVKTREASLTKLKGRFSITPFTSKLNLEGPLKKYKFGESNSSFMFSYKTSYLKQSAPIFYPYVDKAKLPYTFNDLYGKLTFNAPSGSYFKVFGFHFRDNVDFPGSTSYAWKSTGFGSKMLILPDASKIKLESVISYSNYGIQQKEVDNKPRRSDINALDLGLNVFNQLPNGELVYGLEINSIKTSFEIFNSNDRRITQDEYTTQFGTFMQYKVKTKRSVIDAGLRFQYYASLGDGNLEPRIQYRFTLLDKKLFFKAAAGRYSQNLLSSSSDRDVVNLFYGFLSGPDNLPNTFNGNPVTHSLQKANHLVGGFDYTVNKNSDITIEAYLKDFTQLTNINRDKLFDNTNANSDKPDRLKQDYILESGKAYGGDFRYRYTRKNWYLWAVYSLNYVTRFDGVQTYFPVFDRRHNINVVASYKFGKSKNHSLGLRWNYGSGFPFTQTQGFYEKSDFNTNGLSTDFVNQNGTLGILYGPINGGRLPQYHRMDASYKWEFKMAERYPTEIVVSVTNVYNRENIFYFDRVNFKRVNQLPILPSVAFNVKF